MTKRDEIAEIIAHPIEPLSWAALGNGDTLAHRNRRVSSERKAARILAALTAAGFVVVPKEPTAVMRDAAFSAAAKVNPGRDASRIAAVALDAQTIYRAMLEAVRS